MDIPAFGKCFGVLVINRRAKNIKDAAERFFANGN